MTYIMPRIDTGESLLGLRSWSVTKYRRRGRASYIFQNLKFVVLTNFISVDADSKVDFLWVVVSIRCHLEVVHWVRGTLLDLFEEHFEGIDIKGYDHDSIFHPKKVMLR